MFFLFEVARVNVVRWPMKNQGKSVVLKIKKMEHG